MGVPIKRHSGKIGLSALLADSIHCMFVWMYVCVDVCLCGCMFVWMYVAAAPAPDDDTFRHVASSNGYKSHGAPSDKIRK